MFSRSIAGIVSVLDVDAGGGMRVSVLKGTRLGSRLGLPSSKKLRAASSTSSTLFPLLSDIAKNERIIKKTSVRKKISESSEL
jgi:3-methyladenine DNA glycosylase AlkC